MTSSMRARRPRQRGAAALAVALILLFGMTIVAFFGNRGMLFEQRTSANQYRATRAFEMAEAGLEWAVARLNDNAVIGTACTATGATDNFRKRYLPASAAGFTVSPIRSGCSIAANGATTCSCPTAGTPVLANSGDPRFTVQFGAWGGDPWTVEVTSFGCTNEGPECNPGSTARSDAVAVVRALYKMKPALPSAPGAGLITGSYAITGGNLSVINMDVESNGITINSGTTVDLGTATNAITLPGTPARASVLDNDPSLAALTNADATGDIFFASFFGETMAEFKNNPKTWLITSGSCGTNTRCSSCGGENACGSAISAAINSGEFRFWSDADVKWTNNLPAVSAQNPLGTLGTATDPIIVASDRALKLSSNLTAYGLFYAATATVTEEWTFTGSGTAKVFGAFVSRGSFDKGAGTLDLIYDANIFKPENLQGTMVRVPGSWRDKSSEFN